MRGFGWARGRWRTTRRVGLVRRWGARGDGGQGRAGALSGVGEIGASVGNEALAHLDARMEFQKVMGRVGSWEDGRFWVGNGTLAHLDASLCRRHVGRDG